MADLAGTSKTPAKKMISFLIVFSIIVLWVLPLFSGTILSAAYEFIVNDIIYEDYDTAIGISINICTVLSEFAGFAVIIFVSMSDLKNRKRTFVIFQLVSYFISMLCTLFINSLSGTSFWDFFWIYLSFAAIPFAVSTAAFLVLLFILKKKNADSDIPDFSGKLVSSKNPCLSSAAIISVIWLAVKTVSAAIDTVYLLIDYGNPTTVGDVIYLITPYAENIILSLTGYFITVGLMYIFSLKYHKLCGRIESVDTTDQTSH